jgi:hypothetical protein
MSEGPDCELLQRRYTQVHGCSILPGFRSYLNCKRAGAVQAQVGYRRAFAEPLFLENYLDAPIELVLSTTLRRAVPRETIVELGNLAADDATALVELWARAANDLGSDCEIAVATLTAPLRAMFTRLGLRLIELAPADMARIEQPEIWGRYYTSDPRVCAGFIAEGQQALARFFSRRRSQAA